MKDRGTYALLALFFAGLVGLWVADFAQIPTRARRERMSNRVLPGLLDAKPDDVRKVEILGGETPLVFERRDGNRWQMTAPLDVAADPSKVETLAYNLKELARRPDAAPLEGDAAKFGLAPPERTVKLWGEGTDSPLATLEIGLASLDKRYVRAGGTEAVEVVDARGLDLLRLPAVRWRDAELFRVPSFEVESVGLAGGGKSLKLRRSRGTWHVAEPVRLPASEAKVDGLVADLGSLRVVDDSRYIADDVKPADLDRYGLKTPSLTIEVVPGRVDRRRGALVLHVGKVVEGKDDQVYARRGDQDDVVAVDRRILKDLRPEANAFRSPKVADIVPARVVRVAVEDADGSSIEAARRGNDWAIVAPNPAKGDRQAIQDYLKALDQLETGIYLGPDHASESGIDRPTLRLKVWQAPDPREPAGPSPADPKGDLALDLRIGLRDAGKKSIYARIEGDSTILALPDAANSFLPRNPLAFRDRQVLAVDSEPIEQVRFVSAGRKFTLNAPPFKFKGDSFVLNPPGWWLVEPVDAPADAPSVGKLLRLLANLRAVTLITEKPDALDKFGLAVPALTITWSAIPPFSMIEQPPAVEHSPGQPIPLEHHSLMIGASLPDRPNVRFAKLADRPLVFTLGPDSLATLDAEWRDHRALTFDPARVRKIQLDWPDRGLTLSAAEQTGPARWSLDGDQDAPGFDPATVKPLVEAASKLTTFRFLQHLGDFPGGTGLNPARLTIRFELDDGQSPRTLRIGSPAGRGVSCATTEVGPSGPILLIADAPFAPFLQAPRRKGDLPDDVFAR